MREGKPFAWLMRPGLDPFSARHKPTLPPADYHQRTEQGLLIERNCAISLRDGTQIYGDLYRPEGATQGVPILLAWGPYGKHSHSDKVFWPRSGVNPDWLSDLTPFEGPDPVWWGKHGYGVAVVDPRGAWLSGGNFHHNGIQEAEDCADTIEWLGGLDWGNGRVGMTGVSYLAAIQYLVAPLKPEPLAAINPWEAFSDWYREFAYHGGIPETGFAPRASDSIAYSLGQTENTLENIRAHPLMDAFWASKDFDLEAVTQPAYCVASWSDQGLHLRGTIEAWRRFGSQQKWLDIHGQKKWANYYRPESRERQLAFFDHFLRDRPTQLAAWPPVRMEVRERHGEAVEREERQYPPSRTIYRDLFLDAKTQSLLPEIPTCAGLRQDAVDGVATFDVTFAEETEITGNASLRLWVEAERGNDMDLFVALEKIDAEGKKVGFTFYAFYEYGPVALGWQRVSHRALDEQRSSPGQPVHLHTHEELLSPGEIVPVDIAFWPSSTRFTPNERLRLIVAGGDIYRREEGVMLPFPMHEETRNIGTHIFYTGKGRESVLRLPIVSAGEPHDTWPQA